MMLFISTSTLSDIRITVYLYCGSRDRISSPDERSLENFRMHTPLFLFIFMNKDSFLYGDQTVEFRLPVYFKLDGNSPPVLKSQFTGEWEAESLTILLTLPFRSDGGSCKIKYMCSCVELDKYIVSFY